MGTWKRSLFSILFPDSSLLVVVFKAGDASCFGTFKEKQKGLATRCLLGCLVGYTFVRVLMVVYIWEFRAVLEVLVWSFRVYRFRALAHQNLKFALIFLKEHKALMSCEKFQRLLPPAGANLPFSFASWLLRQITFPHHPFTRMKSFENELGTSGKNQNQTQTQAEAKPTKLGGKVRMERGGQKALRRCFLLESTFKLHLRKRTAQQPQISQHLLGFA